MRKIYQIFMIKGDQKLLEVPKRYDTKDLAWEGLKDIKARGKFIILEVYIKG